MAREATKALLVLLAALLPAVSFAQAQPVDAQVARSYVWSAFLTGAAPVTEGKAIRVTVEPANAARFGRVALLVEAGNAVRLVVQYDLRANNIAFIGLPGRSATAVGWIVG